MSTQNIVGITIGDFNGIGPELLLKSLSNDLVLNYCTPVVYGTPYIFKFYAQLLEIPNLGFNIVRKKEDLKLNALNLRVCSKDRISITPGTPSTEAGKLAYDALELAVKDIKDGLIENLLTAPIDKKSTADAGLLFNGHTQYLADRFESNVQMILLDDSVRVAMVTGHTPLNEVAGQLSVDNIVYCISEFNNNLKSDFGITKPRIAVLGFNPHSGDNGLIGSDEIETIKPAIKQAQDNGILAVGPYPPDGFFGSKNMHNFDGIVGMYHDQVLIPFKQMAFSSGVNYTAGLPIVRTSPDHGTAYDMAGKGEADIASFINALYLIKKVNKNRLDYYGGLKNPLTFREHRREKFSIGVPDLK